MKESKPPFRGTGLTGGNFGMDADEHKFQSAESDPTTVIRLQIGAANPTGAAETAPTVATPTSLEDI